MASAAKLGAVASTVWACLAMPGLTFGVVPAQADPQGDYLFDLTNAGIGGPKENLLALGRTV